MYFIQNIMRNQKMKLENFYSKSNTLEVCLVLPLPCNLSCPFCFQDNRIGIDYKYIRDIPFRIREDLIRIVKLKNIREIVFRIWGGEVFSDDLPYTIFEYYRNLISNLHMLCNELEVESEFCFTSNFVFENVSRVQELLEDLQCTYDFVVETATSYDPIHRFQNDKQIEIWQRNSELLNPGCVSVTLTKQNIQAYLEDPIHFERLKSYNVYTEYYIYSKNYNYFAPSDKDIADFYIDCIDNKRFHFYEVKAIVDSHRNKIGPYCTCDVSCLYLDGKLSFNCLKRSSNLSLVDFFGPIQVIYNDERYTEIQMNEALKRKGCMQCEHFSYCRNFCMASMLHKTYDSKAKCAFDIIYKHLSLS